MDTNWSPPPVLTDEFYKEIESRFQGWGFKHLYWLWKYQPIEDET